jgi:PAS domain-containing protein
MNNENSLAGLDLRTVLDTIPAAIFIIDDKTRILDLNKSAIQLIGKNPEEVVQHLCGEIFHCFNALNFSGGCGKTAFCPTCAIRKAILDSCAGSAVVRRKAELVIQTEGQTRKVIFSVSASPFLNNGKTLSVFSMEDITELVLLREIIPMCSYCKSIRFSDKTWGSIENYLDKENGAHLSHGICPSCARKYHPELDLYDD